MVDGRKFQIVIHLHIGYSRPKTTHDKIHQNMHDDKSRNL
jgi:hypothetical protein